MRLASVGGPKWDSTDPAAPRRELTGGIYFGKHDRFYDEDGAGANGAAGQRAVDVMEYREFEVERIARQALEAARKCRGDVMSVDKRNVLETSRMWREVCIACMMKSAPMCSSKTCLSITPLCSSSTDRATLTS